MLELKLFHEERERVVKGLQKRMLPDEEIMRIDRVVELDNERKKIQTQLDELNHRRKRISSEIGDLYRSGKEKEAEKHKEEAGILKNEIEVLDEKDKATKADLRSQLIQLPNVPHEAVTTGKDDSENELVQPWEGDLPKLSESALPHWDLAEKYQLIDMALGAKLAGSGFAVFHGQGARLQRALITFFLDRAVEVGYQEFIPPLLTNEESATATGHLPDKEGQMYHIDKDNLYLIPTSELPLANIFRDGLLDEDELPIRVTSYTPCFRREAGSYGADVKGLNRLHQFDKVEIVQVTTPEQSYEALDEMVAHVKNLLTELQLPYRIVRLCGGDMGFAASMTYDFEVWSAAQERWLEVSSVSNCESFQANRLKLRFRRDGKTHLTHTLNGSALALPRIIAALIENNQTSNGIALPPVLHSYMDCDIIGTRT